jgi:5-amino-6-(5-phospho-D-ribitylamino)uracil phosphatase
MPVEQRFDEQQEMRYRSWRPHPHGLRAEWPPLFAPGRGSVPLRPSRESAVPPSHTRPQPRPVDLGGVVVDLDGTLLDPFGVLTARTAAALARARSVGVPLAVASARPLRLVQAVLGNNMNLFDAVIVSNGACTIERSSGRVVAEVGIVAATAIAVMDRIRHAWPDCGFGWEVGTHFEHDQTFARVVAAQRVIRDLDGPVTGRPDRPVHQLVVVRPGVRPSDILTEVQAVVGTEIVVTDSAGGVVELSATGADKGSALARWAAAVGLTLADVVAFGDGHNDIGMLRIAGLGVAMAGAEQKVMAAADAVTGSNADEGVAAALTELLDLLHTAKAR